MKQYFQQAGHHQFEGDNYYSGQRLYADPYARDQYDQTDYGNSRMYSSGMDAGQDIAYHKISPHKSSPQSKRVEFNQSSFLKSDKKADPPKSQQLQKGRVAGNK
eukprot:CAMPEP_0176447118 /NCGR_PEP_ID=MMETSP0127-20121128/24803_1 /TAXON_ID=938130 /ORGANISM="Platyophrya macrostoma, Strain WH" /LENGTH=103 /DNA_ID=CAMNT_0017833427 /DNA_START=287 /DNA_END=598 /DNA_ORIENTATION=-